MVGVKKNNSQSKTKRRDITFLVILVAIVILINFIGSFVFKRFDLTSEKRYTLAESTIKLLKNLDDEVYFKVYLQGNFNPSFSRLRNEAKEILDEFRAYSNNQIQYEFIVPGEGLNKEEAANIEKELYRKGLVPEEVIEKKKEKTSQTLIWPGAIVSHKGKEAVWQIFKRQDGINPEECINNSVQELEYSLTNTIRKLQRNKKQEVTFVEGHGELDTLHQYDFMRSLSEYYNVNRTPINGKIHTFDESDAIVITQPDSTFSDKDKFIIDQYIMRGGKVLWLIDPVDVNLDSIAKRGYSIGLGKQLNIEDMLFKYGVRLNPVLVQDLQCSKITMNVGFKKGSPNWQQFPWLYSVLSLSDGNHPIVKNLGLVKLDYLSTIDTISSKGIKKTILLKTSRNTKLQQTPARISLAMVQYQPKESQFNNPYQPVACLLEGAFSSFVEYRIPDKLLNDSLFKYIDKGKPTKMIVVADGDVARNDFMRGNIYPLGYDLSTKQTFANKTFLLNCVNYLLDDEGMLQLRSREVKLRLLDKKKVSLHRTKWQLINVVMPLLIVVLFAYVQFYIRKRRYSKS
ncbi:MAG: gliding motility-associated ABC transporter substrate-binding protein GldG [Bacteroidota bacterium]|nr:gliding motility-associated ABC transporter substrate-binding protein GldG [Bacteroidota bacterium]